jgi:hypothetical protein
MLHRLRRFAYSWNFVALLAALLSALLLSWWSFLWFSFVRVVGGPLRRDDLVYSWTLGAAVPVALAVAFAFVLIRRPVLSGIATLLAWSLAIGVLMLLGAVEE